MSKNIYLLGFMGTGKSVVGRHLAKRLDYRFIDLDDYIELKEKESITTIFKTKGEKYFRNLERKSLAETAQLKNHVISLGGGTPCKVANWKIIENHTSIYIRSSIMLLTDRLFKERLKRPLLSGIKTKTALRSFIKDLLSKRHEYYSKSDHSIWNRGEIESIVEKIMNMIV